MAKFAASPCAMTPSGRLSRGPRTGSTVQRLAQVTFRGGRVPDREGWFVWLRAYLFFLFICFRRIWFLIVLIGPKSLDEPVCRTLRGELRHVNQRAV